MAGTLSKRQAPENVVEPAETPTPHSMMTLAVAVVAVAALYFGRDVFLPMVLAAVSPWISGLTGNVYGYAAIALNAVFLGLAAHVAFRASTENDAMVPEKRLFKYSILYLFLMFGAVVADRWFA